MNSRVHTRTHERAKLDRSIRCGVHGKQHGDRGLREKLSGLHGNAAIAQEMAAFVFSADAGVPSTMVTPA